MKADEYKDLELSTQLLLKEAEARGIEVEILDRKDHFLALKKDQKIEYVKQATKTSLDSYITFLMMENKTVSKIILNRHGIRVPMGEDYDSLEEALKSVNRYLEKKIVIKPRSTNFGLGITIFEQKGKETEIENAFRQAFYYDNTVLVEPLVEGKEYRFLVIDQQVQGVLFREPANVVGDGRQTVRQLVDEKNKDPLRGSGYTKPLEKIQCGDVEKAVLRESGMTFDSVPKKGEKVYLRINSNISTGGDSIDYTDEMHQDYKRLAVKSADAVKASICGVDMIVKDRQMPAAQDNYCVIEINFNPALHIHDFPYQGKNRQAEKAVLDALGF